MAVQVLDKTEVTRLLNTPDLRTRHGKRNRALLAVMVLGGLRIAEATNLCYKDVVVQGKTTRLTFTGKGGKRRTVTLPPKAAQALHEHMARSPEVVYVFQAHDTNRLAPLSTRGARHAVTQCFKSAGLPDWVHPHSLRHTCATMILRATGGDMRTAQRTLGHSNPATTAKYYDGWDSTDSDRAANALEKYL